MGFNPAKFLEKEVDFDEFNALTKPKLVALATHVELQIKPIWRKQAIKNMLIDYLIDDGLLGSEYDAMKVELHLPEDETAIRLKELEIEQQKLDNEARIAIVIEQEKTKVRLAELSVEEAKANQSLKKQAGIADVPHGFDLTRYI